MASSVGTCQSAPSADGMCETVWTPFDRLSNVDSVCSSHGVVVLNRPLSFKDEMASAVLALWNKADVRATVDGGTDSWLSWAGAQETSVEDPHLVTGDFDSIRSETLHSMEMNPSVQVKYTEDQNETDFTKSLRVIAEFCHERKIDLSELFVLSDCSGRFDQIISNINSIFKAPGILPSCKVYILCVDSLTCLLETGEHTLVIPSEVVNDKSAWCGLIPFGAPAKVTTKGLKWNLNDNTLEFGQLVSTSNAFNGDNSIKVKTSNPIVWTMSVEAFLAKTHL